MCVGVQAPDTSWCAPEHRAGVVYEQHTGLVLSYSLSGAQSTEPVLIGFSSVAVEVGLQAEPDV